MLDEDAPEVNHGRDAVMAEETQDPTSDSPETLAWWQRVTRGCGIVAHARWFQLAIVAVIVLNAIVIGLETYPSIVDRIGPTLERLDSVFLTVFVIEIAIRLVAYGRHPQRFFADGWNLFDFTIVTIALLPGLGGSATLIRIVRVLRVVRLVEVMEDLRLIVRGLLRSLAPLAGVAVFVLVIVYSYAVVGVSLFGDDLPDEWGTVGAGMFTCFRILTLDNWDDLYFPALEVSWWATTYFVSYIIVATLVVLNIVIAVVVSSVEQARSAELEANAEQVAESAGEQAPEIADRIVSLRVALDELERQLVESSSSRGQDRDRRPRDHGPS